LPAGPRGKVLQQTDIVHWKDGADSFGIKKSMAIFLYGTPNLFGNAQLPVAMEGKAFY